MKLYDEVALLAADDEVELVELEELELGAEVIETVEPSA